MQNLHIWYSGWIVELLFFVACSSFADKPTFRSVFARFFFLFFFVDDEDLDNASLDKYGTFWF